MKVGQKILLKQVRSAASRAEKVDRMLAALGLGRVGKTRVVTLNESTVGMVNTLSHLVSVEEYKGK